MESGVRPAAICIEWLTHTYTQAHAYARHTQHNEPDKQLNDSLANKYVCHWGQGIKSVEKPAQKCVRAEMAKCRFPLPLLRLCPAGLFIVWSQIQHLRVANYSYCANLAPSRFDLFFSGSLPSGFGLRLTMHANDGICCRWAGRGSKRRRFFIWGNSDTFSASIFSSFFLGYFGNALMSSLSGRNQAQRDPRTQPESIPIQNAL